MFVRLIDFGEASLGLICETKSLHNARRRSVFLLMAFGATSRSVSLPLGDHRAFFVFWLSSDTRIFVVDNISGDLAMDRSEDISRILKFKRSRSFSIPRVLASTEHDSDSRLQILASHTE